MSGTAVIRYLAAHNNPVLAVVQAAKIIDDDPPVNAVLPYLVIDDIDTMRYKTIRISATQNLYTERVQATALFKGQYGSPQGTGKAGARALLKLVCAACLNQRGTINGVIVDSIVPDQLGPSLHDEATDIWQKSQDFFVRWIGA